MPQQTSADCKAANRTLSSCVHGGIWAEWAAHGYFSRLIFQYASIKQKTCFCLSFCRWRDNIAGYRNWPLDVKGHACEPVTLWPFLPHTVISAVSQGLCRATGFMSSPPPQGSSSGDRASRAAWQQPEHALLTSGCWLAGPGTRATKRSRSRSWLPSHPRCAGSSCPAVPRPVLKAWLPAHWRPISFGTSNCRPGQDLTASQ